MKRETGNPTLPSASNQLSRRHGFWLVVAAAVLWSTSGFFTQSTLLNIWSVDVRGPVLAFWRAFFALFLLVPLVRRVSWHWAMLPMALSFVAMNWSFLSALVSGSPANTIWLQNLAPVWVMLGAVFLFHERMNEKDWCMLTICITGVLFILVMEWLHGFQSATYRWWSPFLAVASGLCYAGVIFSLKFLRNHDSAWLITLNHAATAFAMLPLVWWSAAAMPSGWTWLLLAGIGMIQMGLPYLLFSRALKSTPSHIASLITLLEPVLLPVWAHLMRNGDPDYQSPRWWTWLGALLILTGLTIRTIWPTKSKLSGATST